MTCGSNCMRSLIQECDHGLVFLSEQRDHVGLLVSIHIHWNRVNRSRALVDLMGHKRRLGIVDGFVLQDREGAGAPPPERRYREVQTAVAVEIRRFDVRHAGPTRERHRLEGPILTPAQRHYRAAIVIGRRDSP